MPSQYVEKHIPLAISAKTVNELNKKIAKFQHEQGGKCAILTIYWDGKSHICWIYPLTNLGVI